MILLFPDLDTLRLALTSSLVPADVTLAPAAVSFDAQGRIYVESSVGLSKTTTKTLDRIGVKGSKRHGSATTQDVQNWLQVLPVVREPGTPQLSSQAAVLFELSSSDDLPVLVTEMMRLGNDRQGFRWFTDPARPNDGRILLRVIGPPYYTLLRAIDKSSSGTKGEVRAYLERAPRVWVEIGHAHPLAANVRVAEGQLVLIQAPREWLFLDDAPFQDVYDILQFSLPSSPVGWAAIPAADKMTVPLRLTAGNAADVPELWILREDAVAQLDTLVRDADDRLVQRLMFAVATASDGTRTVVLRTRPSKLAPPALALENAVGFKPFWKLPNLYLPAGKRLHPTLRRDAVRRLLADDPDQVVWLYPDGRGGFTPETVPDAAFRSLEDWVDYVIETEQEPLAAWVGSTRFDFEHFVCTDTGGPKPKPDKPEKEPRGKDDRDPTKAPQPTAAQKTAPRKGAGKPGDAASFLPPPAEEKAPNEWMIRRAELEEKFKAIDGPLDDPGRQALWPELAAANAGMKDATEAAVCWLNALWDADPMPADWLAGWVRTEYPAAGGDITAADFDRRLNSKTPSLEDYRAVVAGFLWVSSRKPVPEWLKARLPAVQKYLEAHEGSLPVRAVWLAGYRLAQLSGADVLGLARVRDRLLQRLLTEGLNAERDLPFFLRTAGLRESDRLRAVRAKAEDLHQAVRKWTDRVPVNLPYVDMLFAFALARLGEATAAKKLVAAARRVLEVPVPAVPDQKQSQPVTAAVVQNFLSHAFRFRVEQALAGKPHTGPMPPDVTAELDEITRKGETGQANNPYTLAKYVIDRMREQSRIVEPHEKLDPYADMTKKGDELRKELADLPAIRDPGKLADRIRRLLRGTPPTKPTPEVRFQVLHSAITLAPRVGEAFTAELLNLVPGVLAEVSSTGTPVPADLPTKQGQLLERSLFLAGHYDKKELVQKLMAQFTDMVHSQKNETRFKLVNAVAGQGLRTLRKLGMRDEIDRFLSRLQSEVLGGAKLPDLRKQYAAKADQWGAVLQTLLNLAGGWLAFGLTDHATPILNEARNELLGASGMNFHTKVYTEVAQAYVAAVGQGPSDSGLQRITELFTKMEPGKVAATYTTAPYYSRLHLNLVEEVILAVVSDDFALGPAGRRWLDDDEYLVRRRVHADMRRHLGSLE